MTDYLTSNLISKFFVNELLNICGPKAISFFPADYFATIKLFIYLVSFFACKFE